MDKYRHTVNYYETDRMGITHHSNYIRWMEEARIDFLNQIGWGYDKMEEEGIISPVTSVNCKYKSPTTFPDDIFIEVFVEEIWGVRLKLKYVMKKADGTIACEAGSEHCFMDSTGRIIRLEKTYPELYQLLYDLM